MGLHDCSKVAFHSADNSIPQRFSRPEFGEGRVERSKQGYFEEIAGLIDVFVPSAPVDSLAKVRQFWKLVE